MKGLISRSLFLEWRGKNAAPTILVWRSTQAPHCKKFHWIKRICTARIWSNFRYDACANASVLHCEVIMRWNRIGTLVHRLSYSCLSRSPIFQPHTTRPAAPVVQPPLIDYYGEDEREWEDYYWGNPFQFRSLSLPTATSSFLSLCLALFLLRTLLPARSRLKIPAKRMTPLLGPSVINLNHYSMDYHVRK
jgi:hypothetical protein